MTIGTEQFKVYFHIVLMVSINMMNVKNQCFSIPILNPTFLTSGMS